MPNAKVLSEKQAIVAQLTDTLKSAASGVLVDYKGITVAEDTALRHELRENGVEYNGERDSQNRVRQARQRKAWVGKTGCAGQREDLKLDTQTAPAKCGGKEP